MANVFQRNGSWYYRFMVNGQRIRRKGGATKEECLAAMEQHRARLQKGVAPLLEALGLDDMQTTAGFRDQLLLALGGTAAPARAEEAEEEPAPVVTIHDVLDAWIGHTEAAHADKPKSIRTTEQDVATLRRLLQCGKLATELRAADITKFKTRRLAEKNLRGESISKATVNKELRTLRAALRHAVREKLIPELPEAVGPNAKMFLPDQRKRRYRVLTREEVETLLDLAGNGSRTKHLRTLLALCAWAGLRQDEALHLQVQDVDLEGGILYVTARGDWSPKNHQSRPVEIGPRLAKELRRHLAKDSGCMAHREPDSWLFQSRVRKGERLAEVQPTVRRIFKDAGLDDPKIKPGTHALRRFFASELLASGVDLETVRELGGWSDATVVAHSYLHTTGERRRKAVGLF